MRTASKTGAKKGILRPEWKQKLDEFLSKAREEMNHYGLRAERKQEATKNNGSE
jgi:hypothetical protein